jgi:hypothetical protein
MSPLAHKPGPSNSAQLLGCQSERQPQHCGHGAGLQPISPDTYTRHRQEGFLSHAAASPPSTSHQRQLCSICGGCAIRHSDGGGCTAMAQRWHNNGTAMAISHSDGGPALAPQHLRQHLAACSAFPAADWAWAILSVFPACARCAGVARAGTARSSAGAVRGFATGRCQC